MIPKKQLYAKDLYAISMKTFTKHLTLDIQGYRCDRQMLFSVLTKAALDNGSLEAACDDLLDQPVGVLIMYGVGQHVEQQRVVKRREVPDDVYP
jgi:hypothetical protein